MTMNDHVRGEVRHFGLVVDGKERLRAALRDGRRRNCSAVSVETVP